MVFKAVRSLVDRLYEPFETEGFEEVVHNIELVAFEGVLRIGCGEDDQRFLVEGLQEFDAGQFGHLDVQKNQVDGMAAQNGHGFQRVFAHTGDFQQRQPAGVILQECAGQFLVVDDQALDGFHGSWIFRWAVN